MGGGGGGWGGVSKERGKISKLLRCFQLVAICPGAFLYILPTLKRSQLVRIGSHKHLSSEWAMKSQVLRIVDVFLGRWQGKFEIGFADEG